MVFLQSKRRVSMSVDNLSSLGNETLIVLVPFSSFYAFFLPSSVAVAGCQVTVSD